MSIFDYLNLFWTRNEHAPCSPTEAALYFYLLFEANRQRWQMPFLCSTSIICFRLKTSKQNVINARERLKERGLIFFTKGVGKGLPAEYTLLSNSEAKKMAKKLTGETTERLTDGENTPYKKYSNIEDKENASSTLNEKSRYDDFNLWLQNNCPHVATMPRQMTDKEFNEVIKLFGNDTHQLGNALRKMNNSRACVENHIAVFDTLVDWKEKGYFK